MDAKFQVLPPIKRLRLLQQQQHQLGEGNKENAASMPLPLQLPAKKRKESRYPPPTTAIYHCLPTKKRVWALQLDDSLSGEPLSPLDLNVEYNPVPPSLLETSLDEKEEKKTQTPRQSNIGDQAGKEDDADADDGILCAASQSTNPIVFCDLDEKENKTPLQSDVSNQSTEIGHQQDEDEDEDDGILCGVCQSTDGDPTDPIVFCDGCDLMVHTTCYGNPLIKGVPEGDWFCTQCLVSQSGKHKQSFSCCLCPVKGGAMKPTNDTAWAHLVCTLLIPEVFFEDPDGREGIDCSKIPKKRWEDKCYLCQSRKGCVIQCSEPKCHLAFHVTCGLNEDLCIEYKEGGKKKETIVAGFCKTHTQLWRKQQQTGKFKIVAREEHK